MTKIYAVSSALASVADIDALFNQASSIEVTSIKCLHEALSLVRELEKKVTLFIDKDVPGLHDLKASLRKKYFSIQKRVSQIKTDFIIDRLVEVARRLHDETPNLTGKVGIIREQINHILKMQGLSSENWQFLQLINSLINRLTRQSHKHRSILVGKEEVDILIEAAIRIEKGEAGLNGLPQHLREAVLEYCQRQNSQQQTFCDFLYPVPLLIEALLFLMKKGALGQGEHPQLSGSEVLKDLNCSLG